MVLKFDSFKDELIEPFAKITTILNIFSPKMVKMDQKTTEFSQWYQLWNDLENHLSSARRRCDLFLQTEADDVKSVS